MTPPLTILIFAQVTNHSRLFQYLKYTSNHDVVSDWQLSVYRANDFSRQPAHLPQINSTSPYYKPITPLYESSEQGADRKHIEYASHKGFNNPRTVLPQIKNRSVNTHATHADYDDFHYGSTQLRWWKQTFAVEQEAGKSTQKAQIDNSKGNMIWLNPYLRSLKNNHY